ncbi:HAD family hydrolase [Actinacidiphila oryziradicis]|uniref:HAD family hydrolase n=1 Tax=Actinacidiphila oryziradicis TaxID=2571141 RepID=A0A4U0SC41_9ACTN|nr:HAD family hydrolase [Actinacidiphila oryziradicis]TKA06353.1 HAD family hydrolase [Actinacidiphila oryziradicis]
MSSTIKLLTWPDDLSAPAVLVDSERIAVRVYVALGAELGWPLTEAEVIEKFIGRSIVSNFEQITSRVGPSRAALWQERFGQLHRAAVDAELTPVDGILEVLDTLTLPSCVASGGRHDTMRHTLGHTGIYPYFDEGRIFSASEVAHGKPAPDLFLHAAKQMGVNPSACIVVEDSKYGIQAARAAGMRALGYAGGLTPAQWLEGLNTTVFDDMRELPRLLAEA